MSRRSARGIVLVAAGGVLLAAVAFQRPRDAAELPAWRLAQGSVTVAAAAPSADAKPAPASESHELDERAPSTESSIPLTKRPSHPAAQEAEDVEARAQSHMDRAYELARERDLEGAIREFRAILRECPASEKCPMALYQVADCLQALGRYDDAIAEYERLKRDYPDNYLSVRSQRRINECKLELLRREPQEKLLEPVLCQREGADPRLDVLCGPECLARVCEHYEIETTAKQIARLAGTTADGTTMLGLAEAAERKGLKAKGMLLGWKELRDIPKPSIIWMPGGHYLMLESMGPRYATLIDPRTGRVQLEREELERMWEGHTLVLSRPAKSSGDEK